MTSVIGPQEAAYLDLAQNTCSVLVRFNPPPVVSVNIQMNPPAQLKGKASLQLPPGEYSKLFRSALLSESADAKNYQFLEGRKDQIVGVLLGLITQEKGPVDVSRSHTGILKRATKENEQFTEAFGFKGREQAAGFVKSVLDGMRDKAIDRERSCVERRAFLEDAMEECRSQKTDARITTEGNAIHINGRKVCEGPIEYEGETKEGLKKDLEAVVDHLIGGTKEEKKRIIADDKGTLRREGGSEYERLKGEWEIEKAAAARLVRETEKENKPHKEKPVYKPDKKSAYKERQPLADQENRLEGMSKIRKEMADYNYRDLKSKDKKKEFMERVNRGETVSISYR